MGTKAEVRLLLEHMVDVDDKDDDGQTTRALGG
jgi:hypothetical protein